MIIFNCILFYYSELAAFIIYYRLSNHKCKYQIYYPNNNDNNNLKSNS